MLIKSKIKKIIYSFENLKNEFRRNLTPQFNNRYDYFIIWGHGQKHRKEIIRMLRENESLEIKMIKFHRIKNTARFIKKVYRHNYVPFWHLKNKTRYLLNVAPNICFILVLNKNPQEAFLGEGLFRHIECLRIKKLKDEIRDRFNPRENGLRTENHVVHASDNQFQVDCLLKLLGFPGGTSYFQKGPNPILSFPYHLHPFDSFRIKKIKFSQLFCRVLKGDVNNFSAEICSIEDSPHYKYLVGEKAVYQKYLKTFGGYVLTDDYSAEKFDKLFQDDSYIQSPCDTSYILAEELYPNKYVILDGLHRAAKLLFSKQKEIIVVLREANIKRRKYIINYIFFLLIPIRNLLNGKNYFKKLIGLLKISPKKLLSNFGTSRHILLESKKLGLIQKKEEYIMPLTCQVPNLPAIYKQYFGFRKNGTFVEIGAFDGEYASNTSNLADIGWFGFYIEPVPKFFELCCERHQKNRQVKVFRYAIGDAHERKTINVGGPLSTINPKMVNIFKEMDWARSHFQKEEKIEVEQITLDHFLTLSKIPKNFELLIIDVEGYEWNVLKNFDIQKWLPQMVIIELHDQNDNYLGIRKECNQIVDYFEKNKYKIIYKDQSNTIYVLKDFYPINNQTK